VDGRFEAASGLFLGLVVLDGQADQRHRFHDLTPPGSREGAASWVWPGMTFLSPITLRLPGTAGIGFTETFAVTERGCELLTARDRALVVAPA
jgi:Xaa-Pro aminopeptidase